MDILLKYVILAIDGRMPLFKTGHRNLNEYERDMPLLNPEEVFYNLHKGHLLI